MLDWSGPVLDRGPKHETGIFMAVRYFCGPGLDRGPAVQGGQACITSYGPMPFFIGPKERTISV